MCYAHRSDGSELHPALGDRIAAGNAELVDAAVVLSLGADDLVELRGIEIDRRVAGVAVLMQSSASCLRRARHGSPSPF